MPRYEYRCRTCGDTFELSRPMAESSDPADCPAGHDDTVKLLSTVAVGGTASASAASGRTSPGGGAGGGGGGGGGCCGGGCCG
ncbi:zinc ribbon domain-containing protein [Streptomyces sp. PSKA54]|uniref:Zinc ribbon domain-containing protein n=1 Tax=Streptomyces himalayensis subsp. aureolus TaxID=2758039 RepID=A0A7W2D3T2_9ACTN|nr:zinc ribbon domain-containing protein [Streptomyces himalayensis]MBA4864244.1 zinc ribbon domain-containing protein [Streptomyces himalayensis subsp. aureolus]